MTVTEAQPAEVGGNADTRTYEQPISRLAAALAAVQRELPRIRKDQTAEVPTKTGGKYSYTYADLASVSAQVLPLLGKHGLSFTAWPTLPPADRRGFILRYQLLHESGEHLDGEYPLPVDASAQALGSAITYARRYCLCAVTGVSPDDDDDAAAAMGAREVEQYEQRAEVDAKTAAEQAQYATERAHGIDAVRGAWASQYGSFDGAAAEEMYKTWSKGGTVDGATPAQLRSFAAMIHALPKADAGGDPAEATLLPPAGEDQAPVEPKKITGVQRGKMFALMTELGLTERQQQLDFFSQAVGRTLKSRSEVNHADANVIIGILQEAGANVSEPAAGAQSASGETRVPAGSETTSSGGE